MMQRLGDAKGREVLREHEQITRDTLKQHGGAEVKTWATASWRRSAGERGNGVRHCAAAGVRRAQ